MTRAGIDNGLAYALTRNGQYEEALDIFRQLSSR